MAAGRTKKAKKTKAHPTRKRARKARAGARKASGRRGAAPATNAATKVVAALRAENKRLKEELAALKAQAERPESNALGEPDDTTHPMEY